MSSDNFINCQDSTRLHYLREGLLSAPRIIFLHGLGGSSGTFAALHGHLSQAYDLISLDLPGFGKSPPPTSRPKVEKYVANLHDVITSLQTAWASEGESAAAKVILVGHSLGAVLTLHLAAQHPSLVSGLVLLAPVRSASHIPAVRERMMDMADNTRKHGAAWAAEVASRSNFPPADQRETDEALRREVFDAVAASDAESYALSCEMMVDESHKDPDYSKIQCPTLIIAGKHDVIGPVQKAKEIVELIGAEQCRLEVLDCGHQPIVEHAPKVQEAIDGLLQSVGAHA